MVERLLEKYGGREAERIDVVPERARTPVLVLAIAGAVVMSVVTAGLVV